MIRLTYAEIDCAALRHNIAALRGQCAPGTRYLAVVKANGYGHGAVETAKAARDAGAEYLAVAFPEEGRELRQAGITMPILVLAAVLPEYAAMIVENDLTPTVFTLPVLQALEREAKAYGKHLKIHIKVDTGLNRIGIKTGEELQRLLDALQGCNAILLEGVYTHFAVSEIPDKSFTLEQNRRFQQFVADIEARNLNKPLLHAANSGAIMSLPGETGYDIVRGGLGMYGYAPNGENILGLIPALSWKTTIVHIKEIVSDDTVSYGRRYTAKEPRLVATLPLGYGDGYHYAMSCKAQVLIHGKRAPVLGSICMDQIMIDITEMPEASVGDEVVLIGKSGEAFLGASEMAQWASTHTYEILLSISGRVPRVYINQEV